MVVREPIQGCIPLLCCVYKYLLKGVLSPKNSFCVLSLLPSREVMAIAVAVTVVIGCMIAVAVHKYWVRKERPSSCIRLLNATWRCVAFWNFSQGHYPGWYGWGAWSIRNGTLQGDAPLYNPDIPYTTIVYFTPVDLGTDFIMETAVLFPQDYGVGAVAHLLARDSSELISECGVELYAPGVGREKGANHILIRFMVKGKDLLLRFIYVGRIRYGAWQYIRFVFFQGKITVFFNSTSIFSSNSSYPVPLKYDGKPEPIHYTEPHLAVFNGSAYFAYVAFYTLE